MQTRLIIGLLALNLLYYIWSATMGNTAYKPPDATVKGVDTLTLLPANASDKYNSDRSNRASSCYTLGPFNSEKTARLVARKISDFGLAVSVRKQKTMITLNYMVYLEALPTREDAEKVIADISQYEIDDYSIVESGPYKNAIALGSFEDLDKTRRHSEYIRFLGYDAKYTEQQKRKEVYWLDFDELFGTNAPVLAWAKSIDPKEAVQKIPTSCDF